MAGMERFTQRARRVLSLAHQEAERARQNKIGTEHLLLGLMDEEGGVAGRVLRELGMDSDRVREMVERVSGSADYTGGKIELAAETHSVSNMPSRKPAASDITILAPNTFCWGWSAWKARRWKCFANSASQPTRSAGRRAAC